MTDELKSIAKKLNAAFIAQPGATRTALAEPLPQAIRALAAIATAKEARTFIV